MQDRSIPLVVAAASFFTVLVWRVRPLVAWGRGSGDRQALREVQARIEGAKTDSERALLLCDAAEHMRMGARGMYQRALRADPGSVAVIERVVAGLGHRPRAIESLLWRTLATVPWTQSPEATRAALDALRVLYEGPLRNVVRAKALAHARDALAREPRT